MLMMMINKGSVTNIFKMRFNMGIVASVVITSVVSVASCLQVCHKCRKHHTAILPMLCL
jgi:hypothetical protein